MTVVITDLLKFELPDEWDWFPDESGGGAVLGTDVLLHFHEQAVDDPSDLPNLARMLSGFLTLRGRPVATDELLEGRTKNGKSYGWQYQDGEQAVRLWVLGNRQAWCFVTFHCPVTREAELRATVDAAVGGLQLGEMA
jgi:hypothetical protein